MSRFIAAAVAVLLLAACASADRDTDASDTAPDTTAAAAATTAPTTTADATILSTPGIGSLTVDDQTAPIVDFAMERFDLGSGEEDVIALLIGDEGFIMIPADVGIPAPTGDDFIIVVGDEEFIGPGDVLEGTENGLTFSGEVIGSDGTPSEVEFVFEADAGSSTFELDGNRAIVTGSLGQNTFRQMQFLLENHPEVDTLVLQLIDGSVDDTINVETGRLIREAGLTTVVPADGEIYSGGVDLFAAGTTRIVEPGGVVGVHSWCCAPDNRTAAELDVDDPAHDSLIAYLTEMLGDEVGRDFYYFTIGSAPFDGIHEMTAAELARYLLTE